MIAPKLITAPTIEPITLDEIKEHLRVDGNDEDSKLSLFAKAARQHFEWITGRTLHATTWEIALDGFPANGCAIALPMASPLVSVSSVKYIDSGAVENTWSSAAYIVDTHEMPGMIAPVYGGTYPIFTPYPLNPVRIRYVAGIAVGSPQTYPEDGIRQCLFEMVGAMFENREYIVTPDRTNLATFAENPITKALMEHYRVDRRF